MNPERALQAAIGVTFAFSLLWTVAVVIPDDRGRTVRSTVHQPFALVINGTHYVLEGSNVGGGESENIRIIHPATSKEIKRVSEACCGHIVMTKTSLTSSNRCSGSRHRSPSQRLRCKRNHRLKQSCPSQRLMMCHQTALPPHLRVKRRTRSFLELRGLPFSSRTTPGVS